MQKCKLAGGLWKGGKVSAAGGRERTEYPKGAKVQIGAELRCKGGKVSAAGGRERTEYRVRSTEELRRQCEGAKRSGGLWKSGKVKSDYGVQITEYGARAEPARGRECQPYLDAVGRTLLCII